METRLHPCWWCGHRAFVCPLTRLTYDYSNQGYGYTVKCGDYKCPCCLYETSTTEFDPCKPNSLNLSTLALAEAARLWNDGYVWLPLTITIPLNAYVAERTATSKPTDYFKSSTMRLVLPHRRGIARKFLKDLGVVVNANDSPMPHRFDLLDSVALHKNCQCLAVVRAGGRMEFVFAVADTKLSLGDNRADTAWLERPAARPPIWDKVFDMLSNNSED